MAMKARPALRMTPTLQPTAETVPADRPAQAGKKVSARDGKVQMGAYVDPDAKRQLDVFAAMNGRTIQSIFEEMMDDFFRKHGLHRLASQVSAE